MSYRQYFHNSFDGQGLLIRDYTRTVLNYNKDAYLDG